MAEQGGGTPGGRRGYAGAWPPQGPDPAGGLLPSRLGIRPPLNETLRQWARAETGAGRLLSGCRSRSAPASRVTSPPIMSRCCRPRRSPPSRYAQRRCCCGGTNVSGCGDDRGRRRRLCDCDLEDARIARCVLARPMLSVKPTRWCRVLHCRTQRSSRFLKDLVERPIAGL